MRPSPYDLFGDIPVYTHDIDLWLLCIPRLDPASPRAAWYVKGWDVVGKIKRAKLSGRFDDLKAPLFRDDLKRWI